MIESILDIASKIDGVLWGPWTMAFIASVAVYLSIKSGFFQVRRFGLIWKNTFGKMFERPESKNLKKMTPFQATATALASTVGMGNMAGVATALSIGGPGAIFWMWILAVLGMMSKTAEITLAVHYREIDAEGSPHGGPMYYITKGLGWPVLAKLFSIGILINSILTATLIQSHTVGRAFLSSYNLNPYLVTGGMAVVTGFVIIGGIKRIGQVCEKLVPLMSLLYIVGGLIIFLLNFEEIPQVFGMIFHHALAPAPAAGGFAGATVSAAIKNGMARGMLSNEAGLGTAPMVHATANTPHPFQQGIWGSFEVFIDTIVICTITSFAILSTGVLSGGESGIELVLRAFSSVLPPDMASALISIAILTFCLSTQIGFFIYYETSVINVFGKKAIGYLKWLYLLPGVVFAGVTNVDKLWVFANISVGVCAIPNLIAVLALSGAFFKLMKDCLQGQYKFATSLTDINMDYVKKPGL
ncbi:MAG: sodium:alanine symporter family protein [Candidatus Aminicenantes bacterium]|nr:sodium:alanine symporter family protein [Candidatus Aminicenantes bacterium]